MLSQNKAAEKYGTTISVVQYWLKTKDKILAEYYSLAKWNVSGDVLKLRFGENLDVEIIPGEAMPRKASAEEMKKENRVLREKVEYFEDMVAYLDEMYVLLNKDAMGVEKRRFEAIAGAIGRRGQESVRRLCGLAGVSPKCYYAYRGSSRKALDDMSLVSLIRELQEGHYRSFGIQVSMGNVCYDNADMEFLNDIIKTESLYCRFGKSRVRGKRVDASGIIQGTIDFTSYYNEGRPKAALGGMSPVHFRIANPKGLYPMVIDSSGYRGEHNG